MGDIPNGLCLIPPKETKRKRACKYVFKTKCEKENRLLQAVDDEARRINTK
jgi:hypothetical protein